MPKRTKKVKKRIKGNKKRLLKELRENSYGVVMRAVRRAGLSNYTYYKYYKEDEEFARKADEAIEYAKQNRAEKALDQHVTDILDGESTAVRFELDRRHPDYQKEEDKEPQELPIKIEDDQFNRLMKHLGNVSREDMAK